MQCQFLQKIFWGQGGGHQGELGFTGFYRHCYSSIPKTEFNSRFLKHFQINDQYFHNFIFFAFPQMTYYRSDGGNIELRCGMLLLWPNITLINRSAPPACSYQYPSPLPILQRAWKLHLNIIDLILIQDVLNLNRKFNIYFAFKI